MAERLALIVAPRYLGNQWLAHLDGTRLLPTRLQDVLTAHGYYDQIITDLADKEVKQGQLRETLHTFFQNHGELLFYFYGHGILRGQKEGVLATSDGERFDEGVPMREVIDLSIGSPASEVVLIFDCCHASSALPATAKVVPQNLQPEQGRVLLAACAEHEQSWEIEIERQRKLSAFSVCVLDGLNGAAANTKGVVTAASLGHYIQEHFPGWRQHPVWTQGGSTSLPCKLTWGFPAEPSLPPLSNMGRCDYYEHLHYPPHYVRREELIAIVRRALLDETGNAVLTPFMQAYALHGMGGIGKTVMARALCDDSAVREYFSDGILAVTLGNENNEVKLRLFLREWIERLGGIIAETTPSLPKLTNTLAEALRERTCLLILDDVWRREQVEPFLVGVPGCRLLLTTRDAELARDLGAQILSIPELEEEQAITLLTQWAAPALDKVTVDGPATIVNRLGRLALAVRLAGAQLRNGIDLEQWLATFDVHRLRMRRVSTIHDSLVATFGLSLNALDVTQRQLYSALTIFRENESIRVQAIAKLWNSLAGYDYRASDDLLYDLDARALLQLTKIQIDDLSIVENTVIIHNLVRDLLSTELDEDARQQAHQAILAAYRQTWTGDGWHTTRDDGYLYGHLVYHLIASTDRYSSAPDELNRLFSNDKWLHERVVRSGYIYDGFLADLQALWKRLTVTVLSKGEVRDTNTIATCVRCTLIHTSVNSLAANYIPELVRQTVAKDIWSMHRALAIASRIPDSERRAYFYTQLLTLPDLPPEQQYLIATQGLSTVSVIEDEEARVTLLTTLIPYLTDELFTQAFSIAGRIQKDGLCVRALAALTVCLTNDEREQLLAEVLTKTLTLEDEGNLISSLEILAPHLSSKLLAQALDVVSVLKEEDNRAWALTIMVPHLTGESLTLGVAIAQAIGEERVRAKSLSALSPYLTTELLPSVLTTVQEIESTQDRIVALATLLPQLRDPVRSQALAQGLAAVHTIKEPSTRAGTLAALATSLPDDVRLPVLIEGLALVQTIENEWKRVASLEILAPCLEHELLAQTLGIAQKIREAGARARLLGALMRYLPDDLKTQAAIDGLRAVQIIEERVARIRSLIDFVPYLPHDMKAQVVTQELTTLQSIVEESRRAAALEALAPYLMSELLSQGLTIAQAIEEDKSRSRALVALAPYLSDDLLIQALATAKAFEERSRVEALTVLAFHLSNDVKTQVVAQGLTMVQAIQKEESRARALVALAPHLIGSLITQGFAIAQRIRLEEPRVWVLEALAPYLTGDLLMQGLAMAQTVQEKTLRIRSLIAFVPHLTNERKTLVVIEALALTQEFRDERLRSQILEALAPYLNEFVIDGLESAQAGQDVGHRIRTLATLAPYLPDANITSQILAQALTEAEAIEAESERAETLITLIPHLDDNIKTQTIVRTLNTIQAIDYEWGRTEVLGKLAPYLTDKELYAHALTIAQAIRDDGRRAVALAALAKEQKQPVGPEVQIAIIHHLAALQHKERAQVLSFLAEKSLFAPHILDISALAAIANSVIEICNEWDWI
jgi:hypothetical protein